MSRVYDPVTSSGPRRLYCACNMHKKTGEADILTAVKITLYSMHNSLLYN